MALLAGCKAEVTGVYLQPCYTTRVYHPVTLPGSTTLVVNADALVGKNAMFVAPLLI